MTNRQFVGVSLHKATNKMLESLVKDAKSKTAPPERAPSKASIIHGLVAKAYQEKFPDA